MSSDDEDIGRISEIDKLYEDAEFIDPPNTLKKKAGAGGIAEHILKKSQDFIKENDIDFIPYAKEHLKKINDCVKKLHATQDEGVEKLCLEEITENVMRLKAHGGMFNYAIMSSIADIALNCLEVTSSVNADLHQIITAHNNSIEGVIITGLKGDGGEAGAKLVSAFRLAAIRYQKKYAS
jgi:hypothetical protein